MNARRRKPSLGQHFLVSEPVVNRLVEAIGPRLCDTMVEIGPGRGVLTERLAERVRLLHAIELDSRLARKLKSCSPGNVVIHCADALTFDYSSIADASSRIRLVGNLPYSISTELILSFIQFLQVVEDFCFMVQREVARRLTASCGTKQYGRLTVSVARWMSVETLFDVGPDAFSPPPEVQSSVIHIRPKGTIHTSQNVNDRFEEVVRIAFGKRRKTLRNSLAGSVCPDSMERAGIDSGLRAENLTVEQFERLAKFLADKDKS